MSIDRLLRTELTQEQYAAAIDPAQEVLCLACAGSGKSRTLAYRIARLLAEGEEPGGIVAFTFTEKAADAIKRRVSEALDTAGLDSTIIGAMYIGTIHGYCQHVLGDIDASYRQFDVLDENRLKLYLISRFYQLGLQDFRARDRSGRYFETIKQISDAWKTANDELLDFAEITAADRELGELLIRLDDSLRTDQFVDFSLMIRSVVEALRRNEAGVENAVGSLRHLMVDEYQDVNPSQEALIRILHQKSRSLFAVGDDDQAIYSWRGADVSNILEFDQRYPNCRVHTLSQNFRSTQPIVEASAELAASLLGPSRIAKSPAAYSDVQPQDLRVLWFPSRPEEARWVARRILDLVGTSYQDNDGVRGLTPGDFAILMRSTRSVEGGDSARHSAFTSALADLGIPFSLEAGGGPFDLPQVATLRATFELLRDTPIDRNSLRQHFNKVVVPAYPNSNFGTLVRVMADWSRRIHRHRDATRIRLYPQQLVYDLLYAFNLAETDFDDETMRGIGLFSAMILDVESVYLSVDSSFRFSEVLNFLQNAAGTGYDMSTDDLVQRPDAVTVATVHKMKGLEFPCVFIVDAENGRFPGRRGRYRGWLPEAVVRAALDRGAYQSTPEEEIRLFYTAATRAERYLYISGSERLPQGVKHWRQSEYARRMAEHPRANDNAEVLPSGLSPAAQRRRLEDSDFPTSFSEVRYYLKCPRSYQLRERFGFNPVVPEMFGYGRTVHTSIQKLHELHPASAPASCDVESVVGDTFHLKHVPPSNDPISRPGAYENARRRAVEIAHEYVSRFGNDFEHERQMEAVFEIPALNCVISGSIDLMLHEDSAGNILKAHIIDFKTMEGGEQAEASDDLDWTELALQVQLYARAADQVLGRNARTGNVHLLKDNQRIEIPIDQNAVDAALNNIEWAVAGIVASDFPMRPHPDKCQRCDFRLICPQRPEDFGLNTSVPPAIHLPDRTEMVPSFGQFIRREQDGG